MSYHRLMQYAREIEESAAEAEYVGLSRAAGRGAIAIDYGKIRDKYHDCATPLFEPFTQVPDPAAYDEVIADLQHAMSCLAQDAHFADPITKKSFAGNRDLRAIESAADRLADWTGAAASAFKDNFLDPFPAVATNQFLILGVMKGAVEAEQAIWRKTREDIVEVAHRTLDALDNLNGCGKNGINFALGVAGAIVAVAGIPFTGGASAVVPALGAAVTAAGVVKQGAEVVRGGGATAEQVIGSMRTAIERLTELIHDRRKQVAATLNDYAGEVEQGRRRSPSPFMSPRPKLADMEGNRLISDQGVGRTW